MFAFVLPAIQISIFCLAIGGAPTALKFGIVNDEIVGAGSSAVNCGHAGNSCDFSNISCRLIDSLSNGPTFQLVPFADQEAAVEATRRGQIWGSVKFGANFSKALIKTFIQEEDAEAEQREMSKIRVSVVSSCKRCKSSAYFRFCLFHAKLAVGRNWASILT